MSIIEVASVCGFVSTPHFSCATANTLAFRHGMSA